MDDAIRMKMQRKTQKVKRYMLIRMRIKADDTDSLLSY